MEFGNFEYHAVCEEEMDLVELEVEGMVAEGLASLDLKKIAELTLYATYQAYELPERVARLYGFFSWSMFKDVSIKDMLTADREPLEQMDDAFLEAWIAYLREQNDRYTRQVCWWKPLQCGVERRGFWRKRNGQPTGTLNYIFRYWTNSFGMRIGEG